MRSHRIYTGLVPFLVVCCLSTLAARADIPKPRPTPTPPVKTTEGQLTLTTDDNVKQARLRIPAGALKGNAKPANARTDASEISPTRTVVAGIALTAAIAVSGLLLVRGRGGRGRTLLLVALIGSAGIVATVAVGNAPPPRRPIEPAPGVVVIPAGGLKMPVVIEIVDDGPIQLTIPAGSPAPKPAN